MKLSGLFSAFLLAALASSLQTVHLDEPRSDGVRPITNGILGYKRHTGSAHPNGPVLGYKRDTGSTGGIEPRVGGCDETAE
ncbi:hypothetical protein PWT90_05583 [Aphanocladium album]|nr:hypothetical protein PWT90_05583 [Aphanocladium album]